MINLANFISDMVLRLPTKDFLTNKFGDMQVVKINEQLGGAKRKKVLGKDEEESVNMVTTKIYR